MKKFHIFNSEEFAQFVPHHKSVYLLRNVKGQIESKCIAAFRLKSFKSIILILTISLLSSCIGSRYTYYTPRMAKADGYAQCHTYHNTAPVKKDTYKRKANWRHR